MHISSITWGAQSSDENGYRSTLFKLLEDRGNKVDFVGKVKSGTMADNQHEGHRGFLISEIESSSSTGISAAGNIALVHAGTNDMNKDINVANAPARLKSLINTIFKVNPDACVFVCQIVPARSSSTQARIDAFNAQIPGLVDSFVDAGKKVMMVSMNHALTLASDIRDDLHPNDAGYVKMANAYYDAVEKADAKGWITKPGKAVTPADATSPEKCGPSPSWYRVTEPIASGAKVYMNPLPLQNIEGLDWVLNQRKMLILLIFFLNVEHTAMAISSRPGIKWVS